MWKVSDKRPDTDQGGEVAGLVLSSYGFPFFLELRWNRAELEMLSY